jgi:hypothetical protein
VIGTKHLIWHGQKRSVPCDSFVAGVALHRWRPGGRHGADGYDHGAQTFVRDLDARAAANRWHVKIRVDHRQAGTGLDGVKYSDRVYVVTVTKH